MRWFLLVLTACTHAATSGGFRIQYPNDTAIMHQHFEVKPSADCKYDDGRDARWTTAGSQIESGKLPPGLTLEDGAINGTPSETGTFKARIALTGVTCAGKSMPDQHVDVSISVY